MDRDKIDDYKKKFESFLDFDIKKEYDTYADKVYELVEYTSTDNQRLSIKVEHVREFMDISYFMKDPTLWIFAWEEALNDYISANLKDELDVAKLKFGDSLKYKIGFEGIMGSLLTSPRFLMSRHLNSFTCVEGIITRSGLVTPKILKSMHFPLYPRFPTNSKYFERNYHDETSILGKTSVVVFPKTIPDTDQPCGVEYGLCTYKDTQTIHVQEMPESAPAGQLPRSIMCHLEDDLVDKFKPGDRVRVTGIYHLVRPDGQGRKLTSRVSSIVNSNNICPAKDRDWTVSAFDVAKLRNLSALAKNRGVSMLDILSRSVAPSIYGHNNIKKAILLQAVGGVEQVLENGIKQRGDVHLLLVGDPGTAKSQLVRFALNCAMVQISTTGRASTGVGLTAAVVRDKDTGEPTLAAGAMVLGDRGLVGVDEFDKMNEIDRASMHEVMEQQTCTIQKAGVHTTLNARVSIIAAANPIYGSYNPKISVQKNIGLPDSLLSRFDLVFIVLDKRDEELDREIAQHVCRLHINYEMTTKKKSEIQEQEPEKEEEQDQEEKKIDEDGDVKMTQKKPKEHPRKKNKDDFGESEDLEEKLAKRNTSESVDLSSCIFSLAFLRKYVKFAKKRILPTFPADNDEYGKIKNLICSKYSEMREMAGTRHNDETSTSTGNIADLGERKSIQTSLPVTPRSLEGLMRLIKAHAKLRLSARIEECDVEAAYELMKSTIFHEEEEIDRMKTGENGMEDEVIEKQIVGKKRKRDEIGCEINDDIPPLQFDDEEEEIEGEGEGGTSAGGMKNVLKKEQLHKMVKDALAYYVNEKECDELDTILVHINAKLIPKGFNGLRDKELAKIIDEDNLQYIVEIGEDERTIFAI